MTEARSGGAGPVANASLNLAVCARADGPRGAGLDLRIRGSRSGTGASLGARRLNRHRTSKDSIGRSRQILSVALELADRLGRQIETYGSEGWGSNPSGCASSLVMVRFFD